MAEESCQGHGGFPLTLQKVKMLPLTFAQKQRLSEGLGVSFQAQTHKTPLPLPPPSLDRKGLRTGTYEIYRLNKPILWGCRSICKNEVPFHDLRTNGLYLKRDPQTLVSKHIPEPENVQ